MKKFHVLKSLVLIALAAPLSAAELSMPLWDDLQIIPAGEFAMGSAPAEIDHDRDESPRHIVKLDSFRLSKYMVTRAEFTVFVAATNYDTGRGCFALENGRWLPRIERDWQHPGYAQSERDPVVCVSWHDAQAYAKWLSQKSGKTYRLPTEAEYEYATRAGTTSSRFWGDTTEQACVFANVGDVSLQNAGAYTVKKRHPCDDRFIFTAPVGSFRANPWGLFDMLGNAWAWTQDCYHADYHAHASDPNCSLRVARGGSWQSSPALLRVALRAQAVPDGRSNLGGFRLAADN